MSTPRNVWLPGAGVWACLPPSSPIADSVECDSSSPVRINGNSSQCHDLEVHGNYRRKRSRTSSPPVSRSRKDTGLNLGYSDSRGKESNLVYVNAEVEKSGAGFRDKSVLSRIQNGDQGASSSIQEVMCPICLANTEESSEAVLQWCMHKFCIHCIEEWSRVRRVCPLCKAEYRGWYYSVQSNNEFLERILPPVAESNTQLLRGDVPARQTFSRSHSWRDPRRPGRGRRRRPILLGRQSVAPDVAVSRSGSFPTQRSFGLPRQHQSAEAMRYFEEQAAVKVLRWRRSIYEKNLRAIPFEVGKRSISTKVD